MLQSLTVRQGRRMSGTFQKPGVPTNHLVPKKGIPQPIIISVLDLSGFTDTTGIVNDSKVDTIVGGGQKWINDPATVSRGETFSQEGANIKHCSDRTRKRRFVQARTGSAPLLGNKMAACSSTRAAQTEQL